MKICARCKSKVEDNAEFCLRCGSDKFERPQQRQQAPQGQQGVRPRPQMNGQQGQQGQQAPQGQRPRTQMNGQQAPQGQRPRPQMNGQQGMSGQQGMNGQRPRPQVNRPQMNGQQQNINEKPQVQQVQRPIKLDKTQTQTQNINDFQNEQPANYYGTFEEYEDKPAKKIGLGKKNKKNNNNMQDTFDSNNMFNGQFDNTNNMQQDNNYSVNNSEADNNVITVLSWILLFVELAIPIVNIVVIIKTLTNKYENKTKKNYIIAALIMIGISIILGTILGITATALVVKLVG